MLMEARCITRPACFLMPDDFYRNKNGLTFRSKLDLYDQREPADFTTLRHRLETQGPARRVWAARSTDRPGGRGLSPTNVEHYARIVKDNGHPPAQ